MTTTPFPATPEPNRPAHETTPLSAITDEVKVLPAYQFASALEGYSTHEYLDADLKVFLREAARRLRSEPASQLEQASAATALPDAREGLDARRYDWLRRFNQFAVVNELLNHVEFPTLDSAVDHCMAKAGPAPALPPRGSTLMPAATESTVEEFKSNFIRELKSALALAETHIDALQKQIAATPATERHVSAQGLEDTARLDWIIKMMNEKGSDYFGGEMEWPLRDPQEIMEDRMEVVFNRAAIDAARKAQPPGAQPNEGGGK